MVKGCAKISLTQLDLEGSNIVYNFETTLLRKINIVGGPLPGQETRANSGTNN